LIIKDLVTKDGQEMSYDSILKCFEKFKKKNLVLERAGIAPDMDLAFIR
jgi:hypothetical protein